MFNTFSKRGENYATRKSMKMQSLETIVEKIMIRIPLNWEKKNSSHRKKSNVFYSHQRGSFGMTRCYSREIYALSIDVFSPCMQYVHCTKVYKNFLDTCSTCIEARRDSRVYTQFLCIFFAIIVVILRWLAAFLSLMLLIIHFNAF